MSVNDPRMEFRPGPKRRSKLEALRKRMSALTNRNISMSDVLKAIVDYYFTLADRDR